ncbi:MAG TPA: hypothetical protein VKQ72_14490, partial [Aggregatilineales bacterium]|nr:hypothetical protein [Aggregatilineales bacterium]
SNASSANGNNRDNAGNEIRPENIYLWNFSTVLATSIALQPWNASLETGKTRYTLRSEPAWSPDGKSLAWTEIMTDQTAGHNTDLQDESLVVYDLAAHKATTIVAQLAAHTSFGNAPAMSKVFFGPDGLLAVRVRVTHPDANLYFYNRNGQQLAEVDQLSKADQAFDYGDAIWLSGLDKAYLSCFNCSNKIDPQTGAVSMLHGAPEMYSTLAPHKLSLYYGKDSGTESNTTWIIAYDGTQVGTFEGARMALLSDAAISPDGMVIAAAEFVGQSSTPGISIFEAWNQHTYSDSIALLGMGWGPTAWRVRPDSVN